MAGPVKRKRSTRVEAGEEAPSAQPLSESAPIPLRSRKIRFSSSSPPPKAKEDAIEPEPEIHESALEDSEDDDDAAPEAISLSTAHAQSRAINADAARAAQARNEAAKKRRRQRDARLKEQASKAKKTKLEQVTEQDNTAADASKNALPTFLPESLLESIPAVRPPTPPLGQETKGSIDGNEVRRNQHVYKGIVKLPSEGPVRDLQIGSLNVSVLEERNGLLPPKADLKARATRENWLRGRATMPGKKGKGSAGKMERRPFGKSNTIFA